MTITVIARRFRCGAQECPHHIFTEPMPDVAAASARRTARLAENQRHVGLALGGAGGARLAQRLGVPVSGTTLLRPVRRGFTACDWHRRLGVAARPPLRFDRLRPGAPSHRRPAARSRRQHCRSLVDGTSGYRGHRARPRWCLWPGGITRLLERLAGGRPMAPVRERLRCVPRCRASVRPSAASPWTRVS